MGGSSGPLREITSSESELQSSRAAQCSSVPLSTEPSGSNAVDSEQEAAPRISSPPASKLKDLFEIADGGLHVWISSLGCVDLGDNPVAFRPEGEIDDAGVALEPGRIRPVSHEAISNAARVNPTAQMPPR